MKLTLANYALGIFWLSFTALSVYYPKTIIRWVNHCLDQPRKLLTYILTALWLLAIATMYLQVKWFMDNTRHALIVTLVEIVISIVLVWSSMGKLKNSVVAGEG